MKQTLDLYRSKKPSSFLDNDGYHIETGYNKDGVNRQGRHFFDAAVDLAGELRLSLSSEGKGIANYGGTTRKAQHL